VIRCFIAIDLDSEVRQRLGDVQDHLRAALRGEPLRWVRPDGVHLTLKFLGDQPADRIEPIQRVLSDWASGVDPFDLQITGAGAFPDAGRPRVVWVGVHESSGRLPGDVDRLEAALEPLGVRREGRPYQAHLTLARVKDPLTPTGLHRLQQELPAFGESVIASLHVEDVVLFRSELRPTGAEYSALATSRLGRGGGGG
jgi:RNA 2',3'-cyclic 3'-phosphodiesterase